METYTFLRELADSWVLLAMFTFFVGAGVWAYWPSQRDQRVDASMIPFRDTASGCSGDCETCRCEIGNSKDDADG